MATKKIRLREICHARSGDKANRCNVGLIANDKKFYPTIEQQVTAEKVKEFFSHFVEGEVYRYELPNIKSLNFVLCDALNGGSSSCIRVDNLGKCFGANLLRMEIEIEESLLQ